MYSLPNRTAFGSLVHPQTGEANGAFFIPDELSRRAEEIARAGVAESVAGRIDAFGSDLREIADWVG